MTTPPASVTEYCNLAVRSMLMTDEEVRRMRDAWQASKGGSETDVRSFRRYLVRKNSLTLYQAALLLRGRGDGFFLGDYKILDRLGSGQTAGVYQAAHSTTGQLVALKVLPVSKARDQHVLSRFQREGRLLTQLDHPNVVRAYHIGQHRGVYFIVMEHLAGETLDKVLARRTRLAPDEAARIVYQALQGLEHLHGKRMVHRDLKPANLMLNLGRIAGKPDTTLDATVKVLDIGLGREHYQEDATFTQDMQLTGEGALLGTPDYLAPEQARDARTTDIRADIYSLGCVLYHLITGRQPFPDKSVMSQMVRHATEIAAPLSQFAPGVHPGLEDVVSRMMEKDPSRRPSTPSDAAELLRPYLPSRARQAEQNKLLPAFQEWLESESMMELPAAMTAAKSGIVTSFPPAPPLQPQSTASPQPPKKSAVAEPTPGPAQPRHGSRNNEATSAEQGQKSKPSVRMTDPATRKNEAAAAEQAATRNYSPSPEAPASMASRSPSIPFGYEEISVELVEFPTQRQEIQDDERRSLLDLDRRDFILLGAGAGGILLAIGLGFGLSRLIRKKDTDDTPAEK